jgi:hypothetical protein
LKPISWSTGSQYNRALRQVGKYCPASGTFRPGSDELFLEYFCNDPNSCSFDVPDLGKQVTATMSADKKDDNSGLLFYTLKIQDQETSLSKVPRYSGSGAGKSLGGPTSSPVYIPPPLPVPLYH